MLFRESRPRLHRATITLTLAAIVAAACSPQSTVPGASPGPSGQPASVPSTAPAPTSTTAGVLPVIADVPVYKADTARSGVDPGPGPVSQPVEVWRAEVGCAVGNHTGVIGSGLFIVGCDANKAIALDARTGAPRWGADLDGPMQGSPAIADGAVYVSDAGGTFWSLDLASGTKRWSLPIKAMRHPVVAGGLVYVGTEDGRFLALAAADGKERWSWQSPAGVGQVTGTVIDDTAYVDGGDGALYAVSTADGTTRWKLHVLSGRVSTPAISGDTVFVSALENGTEPTGEIYALDRTTGTERWRYRSTTGRQVAPPTTAGGVVYSPSSDQGLFAFDAADGRILWNVPTGMMGGQPPAIVGDAIYLATDRSLVGFSRSDGAKLWDVDLEADVDNSPIVSGGMVFIGDHAGVVRAFAEQAIADLLASASTPPTPPPSGTPAPSLAPQLELVTTFDSRSSDLDHPSGLDVGPDGNLYVVNALKQEIVVLDPANGSVIRRWGKKGSDPGMFDFVRDVNDPASAIGGVAVAADGSVYVADTANRRVQQFDAQGTFLRQWGRFGTSNGQFLDPIDLDIGPDGNVYVVDDQRDDIQRFTADGAFVSAIGRHGSGPGEMNFTSGISVGPDGTVYNADFDNNRVQAWDETGAFRWTVGSTGKAPGSFDHPGDVVDEGGRLYVTDDGRVQTFGPDRVVLGVWPSPGAGPVFLAIGKGILFASAPWDDKIYALRLLP